MERITLLQCDPADGAWNMALDQALLEAAEAGRATWRFYRWRRPTLSLGYFQRLADRQQHAASCACDLVRRASGGGAIVHDDELTYSLTLPHGQRWTSRAEQLYQQVHEALIGALGRQQIEARFATTADPVPVGQRPFLCFQRRAAQDLLLGSAKICGSAQRRLSRCLLQHGSVLLGRSLAAPELPGIKQLAAQPCDDQQLRTDWLALLARQLDVAWQEETLPTATLARAEQLVESRYQNPRWTGRR